MTSPDNAGTRRVALAVVAAAGLLATLAVMGSRAADAREAKPAPAVGPPVLPALELASKGEDKARPRTAVSNASQVLDKGVFRPLPDVPGALLTTHFRNNNRGETVGLYVEDSGLLGRGFLMGRSGRFMKIDVPGAVVTNPLGVNDRGQVVGSWVGQDAEPTPPSGQLKPAHGFVWQNGRYETFDAPGSVTTAGYEINNRGWIVGNYEDADQVLHGYLLRDSKFTTIDHPRASRQPDTTGTRVVGLDDRGRLVGGYGDEDGLIHAWRWEKGRFTDLEPPGAMQAEASQINNRGQIVGRYLDARPKLVSFLFEKGRYTRIEVPGRCDTAAFGINDRGQIGIAAAGTAVGSTCPVQGGTR
jgi:hypothetical protein